MSTFIVCRHQLTLGQKPMVAVLNSPRLIEVLGRFPTREDAEMLKDLCVAAGGELFVHWIEEVADDKEKPCT